MRRGLLLSVVLVAAGCGSRFAAPDPASEQGEDVLSLWRGTFVAAMVVGGLVIVLILLALVRSRRRTEAFEEQRGHEKVRLEVMYTVLPVAVVAGLFLFTVRTEGEVNDLGEDPPDVTVEVLAFQWQWRFTYDGSGVEVIGTGDERPELVLPVGATVRFELVAADVIHSFWVPQFLYKRDIIPGVENVIDVTLTEEGTFDGVCAEFCGLDHADMRFTVRVVPPEEFEAWLAEAGEAQP